MREITIIILGLLMFGCTPISHYQTLSKQENVTLTASINSEVYKVTKQRDLPNAFGKKDIWGGKVDEGVKELRFMGLTKEGKAIFRLTEINIESNESVFTRYGVSTSTINSNTNLHANTYGTVNTMGNTATYSGNTYGTANTNTTINHYEKPEARVYQLPPNTTEFLFDPNQKLLDLGEVKVKIESVTPYLLTYSLQK